MTCSYWVWLLELRGHFRIISVLSLELQHWYEKFISGSVAPAGIFFRVLSCRSWSTVQQCGSQLLIHSKLLGSVVWCASFLTGGMLEWNLAHWWSVAMLCMLPKHSLAMHCISLIWLLAVLWLLIGTRVRLFGAELLSTAGLLCQSVSLWNDLDDLFFDGAGFAGLKNWGFLPAVGGSCGVGVYSLIVSSLFPSLSQLFFIIIIRIIKMCALFSSCITSLSCTPVHFCRCWCPRCDHCLLVQVLVP